MWRARAGSVRASPLLRVAGGLPLFLLFVWGCSLWLLSVSLLLLAVAAVSVRCAAAVRACRRWSCVFVRVAFLVRSSFRAGLRGWRPCPCAVGLACGFRCCRLLCRLLLSCGRALLWACCRCPCRRGRRCRLALFRLACCRRACFACLGCVGWLSVFGLPCCVVLLCGVEAAFAVLPVGCLLAGFFFVLRISNPRAILRATTILGARKILRANRNFPKKLGKLPRGHFDGKATKNRSRKRSDRRRRRIKAFWAAPCACDNFCGAKIVL